MRLAVYQGTNDDNCHNCHRWQVKSLLYQSVLNAHGKAGLKLKPAKRDMFEAQVEYLGNVVSAEGIQPAPTLLDTIKQWPCPKTRTEVIIFLRKIGHYRNFTTVVNSRPSKIL